MKSFVVFRRESNQQFNTWLMFEIIVRDKRLFYGKGYYAQKMRDLVFRGFFTVRLLKKRKQTQ